MLRTALATAALLLLVPATVARADRPLASLSYTRLGGATTCPDEATIQAGVVQRLGYDPFGGTPTIAVVVEVRGRHDGLVATITLTKGDGAVAARREIASQAGDCGELAQTLEFAISIAIDPLVATQARPASVPASQPSPPAATESLSAGGPASLAAVAPAAVDRPVVAAPSAPTTPPSPERPGVPSQLVVGIATTSSLGELPSGVLGFAGHVRLESEWYGLQAEARVDLPVRESLRMATSRLPLPLPRSCLALGSAGSTAVRSSRSAPWRRAGRASSSRGTRWCPMSRRGRGSRSLCRSPSRS